MNNEHEQVDELLPWFVNGTLPAAELDFINSHLESCGTCKEAVTCELELAQQFSALDTIPVPAFAGVRERLRKQPSRRVRVQGWLPALALAASLLVVAVLVPTVTIRDMGEYRGLTVSPGDERHVVQVVFAPETTERELRALLLDGEVTLIDGPSVRGVYRIAIPVGTDAALYASRLAVHPAVRFAEAEAR